jgi:hypothetical protein
VSGGADESAIALAVLQKVDEILDLGAPFRGQHLQLLD